MAFVSLAGLALQTDGIGDHVGLRTGTLLDVPAILPRTRNAKVVSGWGVASTAYQPLPPGARSKGGKLTVGLHLPGPRQVPRGYVERFDRAAGHAVLRRFADGDRRCSASDRDQ